MRAVLELTRQCPEAEQARIRKDGQRNVSPLLVVGHPRGICATLPRLSLWDVEVVEIPQMLHEMVTSSETFVTDPRTASDFAWEVWCVSAVDCCMVSLKVCKAGEVGSGCAARNLAAPCCPARMLVVCYHVPS